MSDFDGDIELVRADISYWRERRVHIQRGINSITRDIEDLQETLAKWRAQRDAYTVKEQAAIEQLAKLGAQS